MVTRVGNNNQTLTVPFHILSATSLVPNPESGTKRHFEEAETTYTITVTHRDPGALPA